MKPTCSIPLAEVELPEGFPRGFARGFPPAEAIPAAPSTCAQRA